MRDAELLNSTPRPIVSMSFQLAIPWRVALPQSPPPLHQPGTIMQQRAAAGHQKPANGQQCLNYLSHPRGQAHQSNCGPLPSKVTETRKCYQNTNTPRRPDCCGLPTFGREARRGDYTWRTPCSRVESWDRAEWFAHRHSERRPTHRHAACIRAWNRQPAELRR